MAGVDRWSRPPRTREGAPRPPAGGAPLAARKARVGRWTRADLHPESSGLSDRSVAPGAASPRFVETRYSELITVDDRPAEGVEGSLLANSRALPIAWGNLSPYECGGVRRFNRTCFRVQAAERKQVPPLSG